MRLVRVAAHPALLVLVGVVACGPATPMGTATPTATAVTPTSDGCAITDPLAEANALEAAGRTRRALRALQALPKPCGDRPAVKERAVALGAVLAPAPAVGDENARIEARKLLAAGDAALAAADDATAKAAFEKSWTTYHPNGVASVRLGMLAKKSDPVAARRLFERAATELGELSVAAFDAVSPVKGALSADGKAVVVFAGTTATVFQGGVARAMLPVKDAARTVTFADDEITLDDGKTITRWDLVTGRTLDSRKSDYESETAVLAIKAIDDGYEFVDPKTKGALGQIVSKGARTLPAFAGGGGHVYFLPDPPETTTTETRTIQVHDDSGSHPKQASIKVTRSSPTFVHATLVKGKIVKNTLTFTCMKSEGPLANPSFFSYSGINEKDRCEEPYRATTSDDGSLTVIEREVSSGGYHMTGAITVTDFGSKRSELSAPGDQTTHAVALSKDGALLAWQFGSTTRLYGTKTMKIAWESTKLAAASHATFSADGTKLLLTGNGGTDLVDAATGNVLASIASRVPSTPKAMTGSSGGLAFVVGESVAFVTPEGIAYAPASAPVDAVRLSNRGDRVLTTSGGRPTMVLTRTGFVAKLAPTSVQDAAFSVDGGKLVLAEGTELKLYDSTTGALDATLTKTRDPIRTLAWQGDRIMLGSGDELSTFDTKARSTTSIHLGSPIVKLAFTPDGKTLFVVTHDHGEARVYSYDAAQNERFNVAVKAAPSDLVAYGDRFVLTTSVPEEIRVHSFDNGQLIVARPFPTPRGTTITSTPALLVTHRGPALHIAGPMDENPIDLAFLPSGRAVATAGGLTELFGATASCRAGTLLVPLDVCDGVLTEGTFARALAAKQ